MSKRSTILLLGDMHDSTIRVLSYTKSISFDEFLEDQKTIDAVVRNFEIIGEASNRIPQEFKTSNPQIPWNELRGFRNRLIHEYFGVDLVVIFEIITDHLEQLKIELQILIEQLDTTHI